MPRDAGSDGGNVRGEVFCTTERVDQRSDRSERVAVVVDDVDHPLERLHRKYSGQGLRIVGVAELAAEPKQVRRFLQEYDATYPVLLDPEQSVARKYGIAAHPVTILVDREGVVRFVHTGFLKGDELTLETTIKANPSFVHSMMLLYAAELQNAEKRMRNLAMMPVKSRVAEALFAIREVLGADKQGYFRIPVTRIDIACYAGTTYEAVFRLLSTWATEGLVTTAGKKIRIDDEEKLRALIHYSPT